MPRDHIKDFDEMCQVLLRLINLSETHWRNNMDLKNGDLSEKTRTDRNTLASGKYYPVKIEDIQKEVKHNKEQGNLTLHIQNFLLPPLDEDKEFIPMLFLDCNFNNSSPEMQLRIGMFLVEEKKVFGFRFETAHPNGNHDYCHVQFLKDPFDQNLSCLPEWMPETYPCVLTPAKCPVSLLLCMLISFYGKSIKEVMLAGLNIDNHYKEPLKYVN